ncbi:MAG: lipoate--protein ligase family protein [Chlamydiota bacterium]
MEELYLLRTKNLAIFSQLQIEEALLRLDERPVLLVNEGSCPTIVLGISSPLEEHVHTSLVAKNALPLVRRFSGGGTVIVDEETIFCTWILPRGYQGLALFPEELLLWSHGIYERAFPESGLALDEHDFVLGKRKCGGNALYFRKERGLLHTSFLWDFSLENMRYLTIPTKAPAYRAGRGHRDFLTPLSAHFVSKDRFMDAFFSLIKREFLVRELSLKEAYSIQKRPYRASTTKIVLTKKKPYHLGP